MMVRIRTQKFESENLEFKYDVSVDKEGNFTTTIPPEICDKLLAVGIKLEFNRLHNQGFFSAKSLEELNNQVEAIAIKYSEKELIEEKFILRYVVDTICQYCRGTTGKIYPDGGWQKDAEGGSTYDYNWISGTKKQGSIDRDPFGFTVFVEVMRIKVWKFPDGEIQKEYLRIEDGKCKDDETLRWLNSIRNMGNWRSSPTKEIDYTPQLGLFFKNMLLYIFNMNEKIREIFGDDFDLSKIDFKKIPQLGFSGGKE